MHTGRSFEFNARFMPPSKVAASFVPPQQFAQIATLNHNMIVGPRGSGKTTLLKMLTVSALKNWNGARADTFARNIEFNGAFVAADQVWSAQLDSPGRLSDDADASEWGKVAFFIHTMLSILTAIRAGLSICEKTHPHLGHLALPMDDPLQTKFVEYVASGLRIDVPATTLLGLEIALRSFLNRMDPRERRLRTLEELPLALTRDFYNSLSMILDVVNDLTKSPDRRWGLLFDEIEIAPPHVSRVLFSSFRSFDPRFVIKIALWPYMQELRQLGRSVGADDSTNKSALNPHDGHDFEFIDLTYAHKEQADEFSLDFVEHLFNPLGVKRSELPELFGSSIFNQGRVRGAVSDRSEQIPPFFFDLAERDQAFSQYLEAKGLSKRGQPLSEDQAAAHVRKVLPIAVMREFYVRTNQVDGSKIRSRKSLRPYVGFPSIVELADGNPRTLLHLMNPLVQATAILRESNVKAKVPVNLQNETISKAAYHIDSLLLATPVDVGGRFEKTGLPGLIDTIGKRLKDRLLGHKFDPDYVGSFTVDSHIPQALETAIGEALNAGAIVYVPDGQVSAGNIITGIRGKRFRLCYALCPRYYLPLQLGRPISLTTLLGYEEQSQLFPGKKDA